jgi:patatin-like phospholipase/acyl hydrolase
LSVDGGGIRGIIPGVCIDQMETFAYEYAAGKGYTFPRYTNSTTKEPIPKIAMKDLFDMMAGTSTGSILSTGLSLASADDPNVPKYWAMDAVNIYIDGGPLIFDQNKLGKALQIICFIVLIILFAGLFYVCGVSRYDNKRKKTALDEMHEFL